MASTTSDSSYPMSIKLDVPNGEYYLTTFLPGDEQAVFDTLSIDAVNHNLLFVPKPYTAEDASFWVNLQLSTKIELLAPVTVQSRNEKYFAQEHSIPMGVIRHGGPEGKLVGRVSLTPRVGKDVVELGYYLHPDHQGKGIMSIAAAALLMWAKDVFGVRRVYSSADCMNPASGRTIEKVSAETAVGEIVTGTKILKWEAVKVVPGRKEESLSRTWEWSI